MSDNSFGSIFMEMASDIGGDLVNGTKRLSRIPSDCFVLGTIFGEILSLCVLSVALADRFSTSGGKQFGDYLFVSLCLIATALTLFKNNHLYKIEMISNVRLAIGSSIKIWSLVFLSLVALGAMTKQTEHFGRLWIVSFYFSGLLAIVVERLFISNLFRASVRQGRTSHSAILVGDPRLAAEFVKRIEDNNYGIVVDGIFNDGPGHLETSGINVPVRGNISDLLRYHRNHVIDTVVVMVSLDDTDRLRRIVGQLSQQPLNIRILPGSLAFNTPKQWFAPYGEMPGIQLMAISDRPIAIWGFAFKSVLDRLFALAALVLFSPILLACAIGIKLSSPGPIFFRQRRIGYRNRVFFVYKFRSMHLGSCNTGKLTERNDARIFKFGQIIRKLSFDELPQIFNVLKGDMSLVGPRPHMPEARAGGQYYFDAVSEYASRHRVKPGITGWAQVHGWRGPTETVEQIENRVRHDLYYINNWSIGLDLWILFKTVFVGFVGENAF